VVVAKSLPIYFQHQILRFASPCLRCLEVVACISKLIRRRHDLAQDSARPQAVCALPRAWPAHHHARRLRRAHHRIHQPPPAARGRDHLAAFLRELFGSPCQASARAWRETRRGEGRQGEVQRGIPLGQTVQAEEEARGQGRRGARERRQGPDGRFRGRSTRFARPAALQAAIQDRRREDHLRREQVGDGPSPETREGQQGQEGHGGPAQDHRRDGGRAEAAGGLAACTVGAS
jgi:hypothetical protein